MQLTLTSSDNISFEVDRQIVKRSKVIEDLIIDLILDNSTSAPVSIPLYEIKGSTLRIIVDWLTLHKDDPVKNATQEDEGRYTSDISDVDREFLQNLDRHVIFDLILGAQKLSIEELMDVSCKAIANLIKGKQTAELRTYFGIVNDFTPEEEEQNEKENAWCYSE